MWDETHFVYTENQASLTIGIGQFVIILEFSLARQFNKFL